MSEQLRQRKFRIIRQVDGIGGDRYYVEERVTHLNGQKVSLDWRALMEFDEHGYGQVQVHRPNYTQAMRAINAARLSDSELDTLEINTIVYDQP
jgi:hypothetical protein